MSPVAPVGTALPIEAVLPELLAALAHRSGVVLQAPPGAGKTTRIPLALLDAAWLGRARIVMLVPRRIAARAAARRMAGVLGEDVGDTVGFRMRGESRVGRRTRVEVVTEGVLTRMLQRDPTLDGIGILIFDEFHERSLHADLGLALALQTQELLREDLRILIMSATLDGTAVSALMRGAPVVSSEGREHPVDVRYVARRGRSRLESDAASAVCAALARDEGSVLAFLPGAAEIARTAALLEQSALGSNIRICPLYGDLGAELQDAAISAPPAGWRKVVLATSIAETSLTIDGVNIVVDSGVARVPRFSARTGMTRLETVRVSHAAAAQRAGRAGRTGPGVCYRLWAHEENGQLRERATPELLEADLTPVALELALRGIDDPSDLRWLDPPPSAALAQARDLLRQLDAVDGRGRISDHGRTMASFGLHPRLAHMLVRGAAFGQGATACLIAALLEERDVLRRDSTVREPDVRARLAIVMEGGDRRHDGVDREAVKRVREQSGRLRRQLSVPLSEKVSESDAGCLLALAYPDRIGQRRDGPSGRYLLRNGVGASLDEGVSLTGSPFIVASDLDGRPPNARIYLAAALEQGDVERIFVNQIVRENSLAWDAAAGVVKGVTRERLGAIVLRETMMRAVDDVAVARMLLDAIVRGDGISLPWTEGARRLRDRIEFLRRLDPAVPDVREEPLLSSAEDWLLPHLTGMRRRTEVEDLDLRTILLGLLSWRQREDLDSLAPTHITAPTGSRIPVDYADADAPVVAIRLQELFGLAETPRVGGGRVPLVLHLLSPAHRPVQVTRDLAGFWRSSYMDVRRDMRGRYPRHHWPEDPMNALPTRRAKPRGT